MSSKSRKSFAKAIIFSCYAPPILDHAVKALEINGYCVMLIITGRGPNYALPTSAYDNLGQQITAVSEAYSFPILVIKDIQHAKPTILALDADLALCLDFPYKIPRELLQTRTTFVNLHPGPLPTLAGSTPFIWPVLKPDFYPLEEYYSTAHYMSDVIDSGNIIKEVKIKIPEDLLDSYTATDVHRAAFAATCTTVYEVVKLAKEGHVGQKQKPLPPGYPENGARRLTDKERTIQKEMSVEEAMRLYRASFGGHMPFFYFSQALYQVARLRLLDREPRENELENLKRAPEFAFRKDTHVLQAFADGQLLMDLRKL